MEFGTSQMTAEIRSPEVTCIPKEPGCTDEDLSRKGGREVLSKSYRNCKQVQIVMDICGDRNKRVSACFAARPVSRVATPDLSGHWRGGRTTSTAIASAKMRAQCHVDAASLGMP
jgi:hypothetical protein